MEQTQGDEIIIYQPDTTLTLDVRVENETVWLNRNQIALLFDRDVKTIGKHINNALKEELKETGKHIRLNIIISRLLPLLGTVSNQSEAFNFEPRPTRC